MRYVLGWIRSNPVTVVSAVVVLLSLVFLGWVHVQGSGLKERMGRREAKIKEIERFQNATVEVPSEYPDEPPQQIQMITINLATINRKEAINERMDREYREIFRRAVKRNRKGHALLAEHLFPSTDDPNLPWEARDRYRASFEIMMKGYEGLDRTAELIEEGLAMGLPVLNAGLPPDPGRIGQHLARVEAEFKGFQSGRVIELSLEDQRKLFEEKTTTLKELLLDRAGEIHIYAEMDILNPDFPLQVGAWSLAARTPQIEQLWEGQIELWIQQDIVQAIARTNHCDDPESNVLAAPVKHLITVEVVPGYVGLHTVGGLDPATGSGALRAGQTTSYGAPAGGQRTENPDVRQSDNFFVGPSGRVSNAVYDVRHARLVAIVDFERLPDLLQNINTVNFMTVLSCQIHPVDEYEALESYFIYGSGDAVEVELVIETIWVREWTEPLMPELVRQYVGLDEPGPELLKSPTTTPGMGPGMMPGMGWGLGSPGGMGGFGPPMP